MFLGPKFTGLQMEEDRFGEQNPRQPHGVCALKPSQHAVRKYESREAGSDSRNSGPEGDASKQGCSLSLAGELKAAHPRASACQGKHNR